MFSKEAFAHFLSVSFIGLSIFWLIGVLSGSGMRYPAHVGALKAIIEFVNTYKNTTFTNVKETPVFRYPIGDTYSKDSPQSVIEAATHNSDQLFTLIKKIGGNAAMLSSGELYDRVPVQWTSDNSVTLEVGPNGVFAGTVQSLTNFYIFLNRITVGNHARNSANKRSAQAINTSTSFQ
jgi:hypothetical protein